MASFDDLVKAAQPALIAYEGRATEGRSWDFTLDVEINDEPFDFTGLTLQARALDAIDGTVLVTFSTSVSGSSVTLTAAPSDTATKGGTGKLPRRAVWHLTATNDGTGRKADIFGVQDSILIISQGA